MDSVFLNLLNMSFTASIVIIAVLVVRLLMKKAPKIFSYAIWAVVLFRLLCPLAFESAIGFIPTTTSENSFAYELTDSYTGTTHTFFDNTNEYAVAVEHGIEPISAEEDGFYVVTGEDGISEPKTVLPIVRNYWLTGILAMLIYSTVQYTLLKRKLIGAKPLRENIYLSDGINSPFVMGLFKPKIYLPSSLPKSEYDFIIAHEKCHIKRLDHITRVLSFIALALHWFNPLVWLAYIVSAKDMEMSCDEAVMKDMGSDIRAEYSTSLLRLATGKKLIFATPLAFGEGDTKGRVKNVMKYKKPVFWVSMVCLIVVSAVLIGFMGNRIQTLEEPPTIYAYYEYGAVEMKLGAYSWTNNGVTEESSSIHPAEMDYFEVLSYNENKGHRNANIIFSLDNDPDGWNSENIDWNSDDFDIVEITRYNGGAKDLSRTMQGGNWIDVSLEDQSSYIYEIKIKFTDKNYAYYSMQINNNMGLSNDSLPLPFVTIQVDDKLHEPRYYENGFKFTYDELPIIAIAKESAELPINYADEFDNIAYWSIDTYYDDGRVVRESFDVEIGSNEINRLNLTDGRKGYIPNLDINANYAICWVKADEKDEAEYVFRVEFNSLANEPLYDLIPMVMVNDKMYIDTGKISEDTMFETPESSNFDGWITSTVDGSERPTKNDESNFGEGFGYKIIDTENIAIYINEDWYQYKLGDGNSSATDDITVRTEFLFLTNKLENPDNLPIIDDINTRDPFAVTIDLAANWEFQNASNGEDNIPMGDFYQTIYIYSDGELIGYIGFNVFDKDAEEIATSDFYKHVYSNLRVSNFFVWDPYTMLSSDNMGETGIAEIHYQHPTTGENFETDGILAYNTELEVYIGMAFMPEKVSATQIEDIAKSIEITLQSN